MKTLNLKISFFLLIFITLSYNLFSQNFIYNGRTIEINNKIIEHFGSEYVNELSANNPDLLLYLNFFVENAYTIEEIGTKAQNQDLINISELMVSEKSKAKAFNKSDISTFNILAFNIQVKEQQQVFKIGENSEAVIILPKSIFFEKFNQYRNSINK